MKKIVILLSILLLSCSCAFNSGESSSIKESENSSLTLSLDDTNSSNKESSLSNMSESSISSVDEKIVNFEIDLRQIKEINKEYVLDSNLGKINAISTGVYVNLTFDISNISYINDDSIIKVNSKDVISKKIDKVNSLLEMKVEDELWSKEY